MSDSVTVEFNADGSLTCPENGLSCRPPGRLEVRSDGDHGEAYWALFMAGRRVSPELIGDLIDTYEFIQKTTGQVVVIGTG